MARVTRRNRKLQRLPPTHAFARRLAVLHTQLTADPGDTGDQAIKLLEEYLEALARSYGYAGDGTLGRYSQYLRGADALGEEVLDQIDIYTQVRNCLAHSYGLQTSPDLAAELLEFLEQLLHLHAATAAQLMTCTVRVVQASDSLLRVRDLILRDGYGRLPVIGDQGILGLLIELDVVVAQAQAEQSGQSLRALTVADALPEGASERLRAVAPGATRDEVLEHLRRPGVIACVVTQHGSLSEAPQGIITHADLLYR
jgi:predicted transcriptional regulator